MALTTLYTMCEKCGEDLDYKPILDRQGDLILHVSPCSRCLMEAHQNGQAEQDARLQRLLDENKRLEAEVTDYLKICKNYAHDLHKCVAENMRLKD